MPDAAMTRRETELVIAGLAGATAANALGGAVYGLRGARAVPREWLRGSPFSDYTLPSAVLGAGVGGTSTAAAAAAWRGSDRAPASAMISGAALGAWIFAQVAVIGLRSPLQPVMAAVGVALTGLGRRLARCSA
jgi:hypothetical protein